MRAMLVCETEGTFRNDIAPTEISDLLADKKLTIWLDINQPGPQDIALLRDEFHFHPLAIEDAVRAHERPKIDVYDHYYFIVFYSAVHNDQEDRVETLPIHLFVGQNFLVTVHQGAVRQIDETLSRWQAADSPLSNHVGALLYALLDSVVDDYFPLLDSIAERVEDLEDSIFSNFQESSIETIFGLKKDMLRLRRIVAPQRDVLNVLLRRDIPVFRPEDVIYLQDIYDHIIRVTDSVDTYRDLLSSALDSFLSLQSNRLNQILKVLTIGSIILMSDALIAGIYGMNFDLMPELRWTFGYPFALGMMVLISGGQLLAFRKLKWI